jgi:hypothetical protein
MVNVKTGKATQKFAVTPDKIYSESVDASGKREGVAIIRMDRKKMYLFVEATKSYMEIPFNKDQFTAADLKMGMMESKREKTGAETVNGYNADKYRITVKLLGVTATAHEWLAPEFDPMPIRTEVDGQTLEMRNIKTERPDAALFEIPKGYKRDAQMEQMMKGMMGEK